LSASQASPLVDYRKVPDELIRFHFPVTWNSLAGDRGSAVAADCLEVPPVTPVALQPGGSTARPSTEMLGAAVTRDPGTLPSPRDARAALLRSKVDWEMVIPKRERPGASLSYKPVVSTGPGRASPVATPTAEKNVVSFATPSFCSKQGRGSDGLASRWAKLAAIGLGVLLLLVGITNVFTSKPTDIAHGSSGAETSPVRSALPVGASGWIPSFAPYSTGSRGVRRIPVLRASLTLSDFRLEMQALIESKAFGWVFRAKDPNNFYVTKLEILKPSPNPAVFLTRFAVVDGKEQPRMQIPLPMQTWLDSLYKVRLDVVGPRFTTWIQDQKVDEWTDTRIASGGVGLYFEPGESGTLKGGMNVYPMPGHEPR
jgi:hypothetical protein